MGGVDKLLGKLLRVTAPCINVFMCDYVKIVCLPAQSKFQY
jgi:hypothetical protein